MSLITDSGKGLFFGVSAVSIFLIGILVGAFLFPLAYTKIFEKITETIQFQQELRHSISIDKIISHVGIIEGIDSAQLTENMLPALREIHVKALPEAIEMAKESRRDNFSIEGRKLYTSYIEKAENILTATYHDQLKVRPFGTVSSGEKSPSSP